MPSWKGKTKGGKFGYSFFILLIQHFPIRFIYGFAGIISLYYFLFSVKTGKTIYFYFHRILKYSVLKSVSGVYKNYYNLARVLVDKGLTLAGKSNTFTYHFDGEDYLQDLLHSGKGGILLSGHLGNWEMAGLLLSRIKGKINLLMFDSGQKEIKKVINKATVLRPENVSIIYLREDGSHIFEMNRVMRNKELLFIQADRYIQNNKIITTEFMGYPVNLSTGPFITAIHYDVPLSYFFAMKESALHYHFYAFPAAQPPAEMPPNEKIQFYISDYLSVLEKFVRKYPYQWFNYYQFWNIANE